MVSPLSAIDPPAENVRRLPANRDGDEALARSIASLGVLQPVLVIDGERRARLAQDAGLPLNGDMAPWDDLLAGGKLEERLGELDDLKTTLGAQKDATK